MTMLDDPNPTELRVDQAQREYREAVRAETEAARRRVTAAAELFAALQARYVQQIEAAANAGGDAFAVPIPCRDCLRAVPFGEETHNIIAESGELLHLRCGRRPGLAGGAPE